MSKNPIKTSLIPSQTGGLIKDVIRHIKLIWLLLTDKRVNFFLKLLPIASLIYLVSPIDLVPGLALPIVGALDDAAVIWIGTSLFINLCPEDVVEEHMRALEKMVSGNWRNIERESDIIDAETRDVTGEQPK